MILFLTSSPSGPLDKPNDDHILDFKNGLYQIMISCFRNSREIQEGIFCSGFCFVFFSRRREF